MKQATYIAEVHSRLRYQKSMNRIVDIIQERCRDDLLLEDIITVSDDCESDYMAGPSGISVESQAPQASDARKGMFAKAFEPATDLREPVDRRSSLISATSSKLFSFFGGGKNETDDLPSASMSPLTNIKKPGLSELQAFSGQYDEANSDAGYW